MNKKILRNIIMMGIILVIALLLAPVSNAALAITPSKTTVAAGETFNITVSVSSNEAGEITLSASNGTVSQTHIDLMTENSAIVSCVAGTSGTISLKATGLVANYTTETEATQNASSSVTIQAPATPTPTPTPTPTTSTPEPTPTVTATPTSTPEPVQGKYYLYVTPSEYDTFKFDRNTKKYEVKVPNEVDSIGIYLGGAEVKSSSGTGKKNLEVGNTSCKISVTEIDGTQRDFEIVVTRSTEPTETVPNVVEEPEELLKLSSLEVKNATILPDFNPDIYEYEVELTDEDIEKLDILATANIENASIEVNGNENFMEGDNTVTIVLKSEDGTKAATYTITVTKGAVLQQEETVEPISEEEQLPVEEEKKSAFSFLKSGNTGMIVILIIAIVILIASIVTVVVILIKNKQEENGEMMSFTPNSEYNVFEEKSEEKNEEIETNEKTDREKRRGKHF